MKVPGGCVNSPGRGQPGLEVDVDECKPCRECRTVKPLDEYARKGKYRAARCKDCLRAWAVEYRLTCSDTINENARVGYAKNPTRKRASKLAYRERHAERLREAGRQRYREDYQKDPSPWREAKARRRARSEVLDPQDRAMSRAYRAAIRNDPCFYCGARRPGDMHDDHYYPLSKGGTDDWWNLVRSCGPCNRRKHAYCGTWFALRRGTVEPARPVPAVA